MSTPEVCTQRDRNHISVNVPSTGNDPPVSAKSCIQTHPAGQLGQIEVTCCIPSADLRSRPTLRQSLPETSLIRNKCNKIQKHGRVSAKEGKTKPQRERAWMCVRCATSARQNSRHAHQTRNSPSTVRPRTGVRTYTLRVPTDSVKRKHVKCGKT